MNQFVDTDITRRDQWENVQITDKETYYVFGLMYKKHKVMVFSGTLVSSTDKTDSHDIAEILLKPFLAPNTYITLYFLYISPNT